MRGYTLARMKRRTSIRGIVVLAFAAVVAGLAVATLRYHPAAPADVPPTPPRVTTVAVLPPPAPLPAPAPPPPAKPKTH